MLPFYSSMQSHQWRRVLTFGSEGTSSAKFCRPWGVTIARYSDLASLSDSWSSQSASELNSTSASWSDNSNEWSMGFGFNDATHENQKLIQFTVGTNNNNSISNHLQGSWSTYLIGIADRSNNRIQLFKFDAIRQTITFLHMFGDGPGVRHGQFNRPAGLVFNSKLEQIIVADKDNHRVQVFDMSGSYLFKFGEQGSKCGQFCYPWDIDVCKTTHNLIVSDTRNRRIQMFSNLGRYITHFNQPLDSPRGVVFLSPLQLMVSDFNKHRLLLITQTADDKTVSSSTANMNNTNNNNSLISFMRDPSYLPSQSRSTGGNSGGGHRHTIQQLHDSKFVGFGEGSSWGEFLRPQGVTANGSTVYCADSRNNRVASWSMETQTFDYISRDVVELDRPAGLAAIDNYLVIVDFGNNRVHICQRQMSMNELSFDFSMQFKLDNCTWKRLITFGKEGTGAGEFCRPWGVTIARYSDLANEWSMGSNNAAHENSKLINLAVGSNNNNSINNSIQSHSSWSTYLIGIADRSNNRIQLFKFDAIRQTVTFLHMFGDGPGARHGQFDRPAGLVFNSKLEQIIVADKDNHRVQVFDMSGSYLFKFGERGSKCGQFCYPWDIDVCKTTHNLIVSDTRNRRIQMFSNLGRYITHFNQPLDSPRSVVYLSPLQLMVSDFNKHRLLLITQCADDKTVSSSTTTTSAPNALMSLVRDPTYIPSQSRSTGGGVGGGGHRQAIQQLHDSKFVGFGEGSSWGEFLRPQGVAADGSTIYSADSRNNRVASWSVETQTFNYIDRDVVELDRPAGLAAIDNYLVIVDFGNNRVHICQRQN